MNPIRINTPLKSWWAGDAMVEPFMHEVKKAINRHGLSKKAETDIYNRAYEAVYAALQSIGAIKAEGPEG